MSSFKVSEKATDRYAHNFLGIFHYQFAPVSILKKLISFEPCLSLSKHHRLCFWL